MYAVFSGKRNQRIIPIIDPPKNVSLEFVKTIGNMYYLKANHGNLAGKLTQHFWMYVKERFGITATQFTEPEMLEQISRKSGLSEAEMRTLINEVSSTDTKWTGARLTSLHAMLEGFYRKTR